MAFVLYGQSITLSTLITFVICARWTGDIYYPHIKLSEQTSCLAEITHHLVEIWCN